jgi:hypothetical protein
MGLANLGRTARLMYEGDFAAPGFAVSNLANGISTGRSYYGTAAVLVTWDPFDEPTEKRRIVAYEISTDLYGTVVVSIPNVTQDPEWNRLIPMGTPGGLYWEAEVTLDDAAMGITGNRMELIPYNPDQPPPPMGIFVATDSVLFRYITPSPIVGVPTVYRIRPVLLVQNSDGFYQLEFETELSSSQMRITPISPPLASGLTVSGMTGTFYFYSPVGANEALIQIARDPNDNFPPDRVYSQTKSGVYTDSDFFALDSFSVDLSQLYSLQGSGNIYWWRVGARNRYDAVQPRPYPLELTNDNGWVWSDMQRIMLISPLSQAGMRHEERELVARSRSSRASTLSRVHRDRPARTN